jgi:hypothetical protein
MKYKIMFPNTEALKGCPWMERVASAIDLGRNISNIPERVEYCEIKMADFRQEISHQISIFWKTQNIQKSLYQKLLLFI